METKRFANEAYVSPVVDEMELVNEGVFCGSGLTGGDGGSIDGEDNGD